MQSINLRHATFNQVLAYAKMLSGLTNAEISEKSGISPANVAKYFKENEAYYPNPCNIPALCCALGNRIILDWQLAQVEELCPQEPISGARGLADAAMSFAEHVGQFCAETREQVADNQVSQSEAKQSQAKIASMERALASIRIALEPLASGKITDNGEA